MRQRPVTADGVRSFTNDPSWSILTGEVVSQGKVHMGMMHQRVLTESSLTKMKLANLVAVHIDISHAFIITKAYIDIQIGIYRHVNIYKLYIVK